MHPTHEQKPVLILPVSQYWSANLRPAVGACVPLFGVFTSCLSRSWRLARWEDRMMDPNIGVASSRDYSTNF